MKLKNEHKFDAESRVIFKEDSFDQRIERFAREKSKIMINKSKIETTIIRKRLAKATTMIVKTSFVTIVKNRDT